MGGDYSRTSFDPLRDHSGVRMQQGHPTTDADCNEQAAIFERRLAVQALDTFGRTVVPKETPTGFEIRLGPGPALSIGRGRIYADGLLAENHGHIGAGPLRPVLDRARLEPDGTQTGVLDEMISTSANDFIDFKAQPYLPRPLALPGTPGPHIVYLEVWPREVTAVKDPRLLDPALGGIDTANRIQTVWQVKILADVGAGTTCGSSSAAWDALVAPSPARLTTDTLDVEDPEDPCLIPPGGGYRGLENQYYRVEIHRGGPLGTAGFKWQRDNASVAARIESIEAGKRVRLRTIGRDSILRFAVGDRVEVTDDLREFSGESGEMRRIVAISDSNEVELDQVLPADLIPTAPDSTGARNSRMIRWAQNGKVRFADNTLCVDLDAGTDGLIPIPADGKAIRLEAGIIVSFSSATVGGVLRPLDHWSFAARTEGAQIETLDAAPPLGVRHYARLAVVTFPSTVLDCRTFWPPAEECGCTICVSAEGHNAGRYTIQDAVADLPEAGGTICLSPGDFLLGATPVVIAGRASVRLRGHGIGSELAYAGPGGAIRVWNCSDVRITDLSVKVASAPTGPAGADQVESAAVHIRNGLSVTLARTRLEVASGEGGNDFGVVIDGYAIDLEMEENLIFAVTGVGTRMGTDGPNFAALDHVRIAGNYLISLRAGLALDAGMFLLGPVWIKENAILARQAGIRANGLAVGVPGGGGAAPAENWSAAAFEVSSNMIRFARGGSGIVSGLLDLRVIDNNLVAGEDSVDGRGACIRLVAGPVAMLGNDAQIIGNRLGNVDGYGLSVEAPQASLLVKQNVIRDCEEGAVTVGTNVSIASLSFDNNLIERVATRESSDLRVGIKLSGIADARILGNSVRGVGSASAGAVNCVGFDINGAAKLDFSHNLVTDIGPDVQNAIAVGVFIHGAVLTCAVTANHIYYGRAMSGQGTGNWCGILIQNQLSTGQVAGAAVNSATGLAPAPLLRSAMPAHFLVGDRIMALGTTRLWAFARASDAQIRVSGNIVSDTHAASQLPLIYIFSPTGSCVFGENQCNLLAAGAVQAIVAVQVPRIAAANNVVRRQSDTDAMSLVGGVLGNKPTVTVLGNLTYGNIRVNGGNLPPPFAPLNILAS